MRGCWPLVFQCSCCYYYKQRYGSKIHADCLLHSHHVAWHWVFRYHVYFRYFYLVSLFHSHFQILLCEHYQYDDENLKTYQHCLRAIWLLFQQNDKTMVKVLHWCCHNVYENRQRKLHSVVSYMKGCYKYLSMIWYEDS